MMIFFLNGKCIGETESNPWTEVMDMNGTLIGYGYIINSSWTGSNSLKSTASTAFDAFSISYRVPNFHAIKKSPEGLLYTTYSGTDRKDVFGLTGRELYPIETGLLDRITGLIELKQE